MASSWARPGVKCVCINDKRGAWSEGVPTWYPVKGQTYTVQQVYVRGDGRVGLILVEQTDDNRFYAIFRFRPLVTQYDDVAKFAHLLNPTNTPEHV